MNAINTDDVIQILGVLRESKIDDLYLELPPFKLQASRYLKSQELAGGEIPADGEALHENPAPVRAPLLGFVRMAPHPGAPPFLEKDRIVDKDATLCMIDVLGELHAVKADFLCRIREINVTDGQMVEFDQQVLSLEKIEHE